MKEEDSRRFKRIFALIWGGFIVVFVLPIIGYLTSIQLDSLLGIHMNIPLPLNIILAIFFLINGFFWGIWANVELYRIGKGSPIPLKDTQTTFLVAKGPYKYSRNPMIFGYILIWVGLGFLFNSFFLLIGFTTIVTILLVLLVKLWEERNLEKRFGESYRNYKTKISFLIPLPEKH